MIDTRNVAFWLIFAALLLNTILYFISPWLFGPFTLLHETPMPSLFASPLHNCTFQSLFDSIANSRPVIWTAILVIVALWLLLRATKTSAANTVVPPSKKGKTKRAYMDMVQLGTQASSSNMKQLWNPSTAHSRRIVVWGLLHHVLRAAAGVLLAHVGVHAAMLFAQGFQFGYLLFVGFFALIAPLEASRARDFALPLNRAAAIVVQVASVAAVAFAFNGNIDFISHTETVLNEWLQRASTTGSLTALTAVHYHWHTFIQWLLRVQPWFTASHYASTYFVFTTVVAWTALCCAVCTIVTVSLRKQPGTCLPSFLSSVIFLAFCITTSSVSVDTELRAAFILRAATGYPSIWAQFPAAAPTLMVGMNTASWFIAPLLHMALPAWLYFVYYFSMAPLTRLCCAIAYWVNQVLWIVPPEVPAARLLACAIVSAFVSYVLADQERGYRLSLGVLRQERGWEVLMAVAVPHLIGWYGIAWCLKLL
eukprot:TRINITY_DN5241_c0_g1_i2.p1 TRINITY_DN5241_c0_g1~~TRINITY_DN5241_c0_g1_i2.p1  ORF type:complete len:480 (+),score=65.91 TRINITY_DN5241_c0_g1_i2:564-2003(+)